MINVIEQVAIEPCPCFGKNKCGMCLAAQISGYNHSDLDEGWGCHSCQPEAGTQFKKGTGLYWPDLSLHCRGCADCDETQSSIEPRCSGTQRVANVTLEQVLYYLDAPWLEFIYDSETGTMICGVCNELGEPLFQGLGYNELEAACAALLESIKEEENDYGISGTK